MFDSFKLVAYPYLIRSLEHHPATSGVLMLAGYYVWEARAMSSNSHVHRPTQIHPVGQRNCCTLLPLQIMELTL